MQKNRRVRPVTLLIAFALLIVLLAGMVLLATHQGEKVRFGLTSGVHAFGAAHMLNTASPQYECRLYSDEEVVLRALDNCAVDAALLPADMALALPEEVYALHGVFSVTDMLAVTGDETVTNMGSLSGRTLILPAAYEGSREEKMLRRLLAETECAGYALTYAQDPAAAYAATPGSVLLLPMEMLEETLRTDAALAVRFRLSQQWRTSYAAPAPAGYAVVYRRDIAGTGTFASFENALRDSMQYSDRKRKKTVAMAVEAGLFASEAAADCLIEHMSFSYLEGEQMQLSLQARQSLE